MAQAGNQVTRYFHPNQHEFKQTRTQITLRAPNDSQTPNKCGKNDVKVQCLPLKGLALLACLPNRPNREDKVRLTKLTKPIE